MRRVYQVLLALITLCFIAGVPALAQDADACLPQPEPVCGDEERIQYEELANQGVPAEELYEMFAYCGQEGFTASTDKSIFINNGVGSTFYEQMRGCGYHPQIGVAFCNVELNRDTWYGAFGPAPLGSNENVTFCFQCGGGWIPVNATVHVTNDNGSVAVPRYAFAAYAFAPAACPSGGTGASFRVRSTLSWFNPAINPCSNNPGLIWGNRIDWDARDDP